MIGQSLSHIPGPMADVAIARRLRVTFTFGGVV